MYEVPSNICDHPDRVIILDEAEREIDSERIVIFLNREVDSIELLRKMVDKYCNVTKPERIRNLEQIRSLIDRTR